MTDDPSDERLAEHDWRANFEKPLAKDAIDFLRDETRKRLRACIEADVQIPLLYDVHVSRLIAQIDEARQSLDAAVKERDELRTNNETKRQKNKRQRAFNREQEERYASMKSRALAAEAERDALAERGRRLTEGLKPFAELKVTTGEPDDAVFCFDVNGSRVLVGDFRRAAAALAASQAGGAGKGTTMKCAECGQSVDPNIGGEYPCPACGQPLVHDDNT